MVTNLLGRYATFNSFYAPEVTTFRRFIWGEVVGLIPTEPRLYSMCIGDKAQLTSRVIALVLLETFAKNQVVEVPLEACKIYRTFSEAKEATEIH